MNRKIIIVTGAPGTGKTTLSCCLAERFNLPCVYKDEIKEILFDNLIVTGETKATQYGIGSVKIQMLFIEKLLQMNSPFFVEGKFDNRQSTPYFQELWEKYHYQTLQIVCETDFKTLYKRCKERELSQERHQGHKQKSYNIIEFGVYIKRHNYHMELDDCEIMIIDTTDFLRMNTEKIEEKIKNFIIEKEEQSNKSLKLTP